MPAQWIQHGIPQSEERTKAVGELYLIAMTDVEIVLPTLTDKPLKHISNYQPDNPCRQFKHNNAYVPPRRLVSSDTAEQGKG